MSRIGTKHFDVIVIGGGSAGVAAAIAAQRNGARTLLVESGPSLGGELVSGLPIDGCLNARGEWIVGGIARELFKGCEALDGYIGPVFDWRLIWGVCVDPEAFKIAIVETVARHQVSVLLYSFAESVVTDGGHVKGVAVVNKSGRSILTADMFIDCSGDGDVAVLAGADSEKGSPNGEFQPVTLVFRMSNVDYQGYIEFVRDHPEQFILGESPITQGKSAAECAMEIYKAGYPFAGISAKGPLLGNAIATGDMYPTTAVYVWPTSVPRQEVGLNTTRIADLDATNPESLSQALTTLTDQVQKCIRFMKQCVPGFKNATLSGVAPRIGIRETRRIVGEYVLQTEDVVEGKKFEDGIAKGGHHVDIHGSGISQERQAVKGGSSYDIPYGCLIPKKLKNVLIAGRCLSSTRAANGSARVMGQCLATGEAAGVAAAMCIENGWQDVRDVPIRQLRSRLKEQGAILDGTH